MHFDDEGWKHFRPRFFKSSSQRDARETEAEERKVSEILWDRRYGDGFGRWVWILHFGKFKGFPTITCGAMQECV